MKRKTHQEFLVDIGNKNPNIIVLNTYVNSKININIKCKICGHLWSTRPNNLLNGQGCPKCSARYKRTHEEFVLEMNSVNPNIEIVSKFKNVSTKVDCICKICGHNWSNTPNHLLSGVGCPKCKVIRVGQLRRVKNDDFLARMLKENKDIEILSNYVYALQKVDCRCKLCGNVWSATPANLLGGHGCPICYESRGEKKIRSYLIEKGILFESQKRYDNLRGVSNGLLSYDFYLPNQNLLIEYQGLQHSQPVRFNGRDTQQSNQQFSTQQEHDKRKREYANANGIKLLEIWYKDFNDIPAILNNTIDLEREGNL